MYVEIFKSTGDILKDINNSITYGKVKSTSREWVIDLESVCMAWLWRGWGGWRRWGRWVEAVVQGIGYHV